MPMEPVWLQCSCCSAAPSSRGEPARAAVELALVTNARRDDTRRSQDRSGSVRADLQLNAARRRVLTRGFVFVVVVACTQVHLECERWWRSPTVVAALGITPDQSVEIERLYEDGLPARRHVSEQIVDLRGQIGKRIDAGDFDDELLRLTEALAKVHSVQGEIDQQLLDRTLRALSPRQQERLIGLTPSRPHDVARGPSPL